MIKKLILVTLLLLAASLPALGQADSTEMEAPNKTEYMGPAVVKILPLESAIGPIALQMITKGIDLAEKDRAQALIILLNTPGGLTSTTWKITEEILNADVPVVVYIYPQGARAGSAGVFITYSANIAAMAPATNIGAASTVSMGGEMDSVMYKKVTNDAVANLQAIANKRGRNKAWVERAIRDAVSISDYEAVDSNIVDLVAKDIPDLLAKIDGREVELASGTVTLHTKDAIQEIITKTFSEKILEIISNPSIAFMLFSLGGLGLVLELYNPGAILPGVVGGICVILGFYSLQTLPINYAGILLILFSIILFLLEIKVPSYGILSIGGVISLALGGVMLIDSPDPYLKVSWYAIVGIILVFVGFFGIIIRYVAKAHKKPVTTGSEGLIGQIGRVTRTIDPEGMVLVSGELWKAQASEKIEKNNKVKVIGKDNMIIKVEKYTENTGG